MTTLRAVTIACLLLTAVTAGCGGPEREAPAPRAGTDTTAAAPAAADVAVDVDADVDVEAVRQVLQRQVEAWNRGDLRGFMQTYARGDTLRFASGGTVWRGWQTTLRRYEQTYPDEGTMGRLAFDSVDVRVLPPAHALAFGRWALQRSENYTDVSGLFTLLLERRADGWRIVHDHTSSKAMPAEGTGERPAVDE